MPPAPVTITLTITTAHSFDGTAAEHLNADLTQAARHYGIEADPVCPEYPLSPGRVLFGRDWLADRSQVTTWALQRVDAATVRRVSGALVRTWANIVAVHCGGAAVVEFGGALAIGPAPVEQRSAA